MKLIGLSGYAQSGKDTVVGILAEVGFVRVSFADTLRAVLYALDPIVAGGDALYREVRVRELVNLMGWEAAKKVPEVRALLQRLGTDAGRSILGEDIWVEAAMRQVRPVGQYAFSDVRFPNEADAIRRRGGEVWRINRPGTLAVNAHPSETALDGYDFSRSLLNDGTLEQLRKAVLSWV